MNNFPAVSVIIPVYNGEKFLESALDSVFSQTYPSNLQVIVIDDGSTDKTSSIAKSYSDIEYLYQENQGVSAARNAGLEVATGEFIAFLDADDIWESRKTKDQVFFMMQHPEFEVTGTYAENFLEAGTELPPWFKNDPEWKKLDGHIIPSTMMVQKSVFNEVGRFNEEFQSGEDTDWLWRANEKGLHTHIIDDVLVKRRFHGANLSWKYLTETKKRLLQIARQSIRRRSEKK